MEFIFQLIPLDGRSSTHQKLHVIHCSFSTELLMERWSRLFIPAGYSCTAAAAARARADTAPKGITPSPRAVTPSLSVLATFYHTGLETPLKENIEEKTFSVHATVSVIESVKDQMLAF